MAKDPAFLFYPGDFNTGTQFFSDEQVGKYVRLLMAQHQHGHLTDDQVKFICKSYDNQVMSKFKKDADGLWFNERLEIEIIKRKNYVESRSKNKSGKTKPKNISNSYDPHMENKNENKDLDNNKELNKIEIFESMFTDQKWFDGITMTHRGKNIQQAFEECWMHHSQTPNPPTEVWQWKQKLNTWLTIGKSNGNGTHKTTTGSAGTSALVEGFKQRVSDKLKGGGV